VTIRTCKHRPKQIKTTPVVEALAREDIGDSLTQSVLTSINEILLLALIKCILQDLTSDLDSPRQGSRDPTPHGTTTPHTTARTCTN
jgi:hypothetical protein